MPRQARIDVSGQMYHVMSRGIEPHIRPVDDMYSAMYHQTRPAGRRLPTQPAGGSIRLNRPALA
jgi:hypothetical protein